MFLFAEALRGFRIVAKACQLVGVPDVNVVLAEGDAKRPLHPVGEDFALLRPAGILRIAQYDDCAGSGVGQKNISVWRHREPSRLLEVLRKDIHAKALRHRGKKPRGRLFPAGSVAR